MTRPSRINCVTAERRGRWEPIHRTNPPNYVTLEPETRLRLTQVCAAESDAPGYET